MSSTDILNNEHFWREELSKVNKEFLCGCGASLFWGRGERKGIVEAYAYSIMRAVEMDGKRLCLLGIHGARTNGMGHGVGCSKLPGGKTILTLSTW